ncbi:conserved exported hypothetical protein [Candidatus Sulfobium mesophilum]|uniref:Lipoprotein n=1 Tax=Candidatus Sulfobium mesophilum TaxID=2016548 RepID=A0A2U3QHY0_9BACT|nr:conserved exported hypothetical protein [Candidatus Sulfobium mesophilum]
MKRLMLVMVTAVMSICLLGCGTSAKEIKLKSQSEKADVFREVIEGGPVPKGFVDMTIKASIKTHREGHYPLEPREQFHGNPDYPFLINVDGQAAIWKVDGSMDNIPPNDEKGRTSADPEAGPGVKYVLDKKIRIASGTHKIFFGLPAENFSKEFEVTLNEEKMYVLELKPLYREKVHPYRMPSFLEGIKEYEVFLNGVLVR